jgi:hypothetical protein
MLFNNFLINNVDILLLFRIFVIFALTLMNEVFATAKLTKKIL